MSYIFETVTGSVGALSFKFNGQFALKNYNVEIVNGNRLKVVSTANEAFSLLEADVSEVEINGTVYSDPAAAQLALTSLVYSDAEPVVLTKEKYMHLAAAVQAADRGKINPATPMPSGGWLKGWYKPEINSDAPGTNYPNAGDLKAVKGFINHFYFDGISWSSVPEIAGAAAQIFDKSDNANPSTMKAAAGRYDPALSVLDFFVKPTETVYKEYHWADADQTIYGVSPQAGILRKDNSLFVYSEAYTEFKTYIDVPVNGNEILDIKIVRLGGSPAGVYCNLLGKKSNGQIDVLLTPMTNPSSMLLDSATLDITQYESLSFTIVNFIATNAGLNTNLKFIKKDGPVEEDAVLKKINSFNISALYYGLIDVKTEGAKGDGVTNDTNAIQSCVNKCIQQGGGTLLFHQGTYLVSKINIPNVTDWYSIGFEGIFNPAQRYGTIAIPGLYDPDVTKPNGTVIKGIDNTVEAIIYVENGNSYGDFNLTHLCVKNLTIRTPTENPNIHGINAENAAQLECEHVIIDTGVYNVHCIEPTNIKSGLITPRNSNCAKTLLYDLCISGFYNGILVGEHTNGNEIKVSSCVNGLTFVYADHSSLFTRVCLQRNTNQVYIAGQHVFVIHELNMEYAGSGQTNPTNAWQSTQYEVKDPNNWGTGNITYANVKGNVGKVSTCRIQGGNGIIIKRVGSDTKLTSPGIPD